MSVCPSSAEAKNYSVGQVLPGWFLCYKVLIRTFWGVLSELEGLSLLSVGDERRPLSPWGPESR